MKPTNSWNESIPSGLQALSLMGNQIRELKTQLREIIAVEHTMGSSGSGATWGLHKQLTLTIQSASPTPDANTGVLFTKDVDDVAELFWVDEDDNEMQLTSVGEFIGGMVGEVRFYKGLMANIPDGWSLCTGLLSKFVRGVATDATDPGSEGGSNSNTLTTANLAAHTHTLSSGIGNLHRHYIALGTGTGGSSTYISGGSTYVGDVNVFGTTNDGAHTHTLVNAASSAPYNNRPAYYEVAFIIKT